MHSHAVFKIPTMTLHSELKNAIRMAAVALTCRVRSTGTQNDNEDVVFGSHRQVPDLFASIAV